MLKVLSLGAGVQSTTVLLLAIANEIERPDHVIFADTGAEPKAVYEHLEKLRALMTEHEIPFHLVTNGRNLRQDVAALYEAKDGRGTRFVTIPAYTMEAGKPTEGRMRRQCTRDFKVDPIAKLVRQLAGIKRFTGNVPLVEQWFGISLDEIRRMRLSPHKWATYYYPLIDLRWTRDDCKRWLREHGWDSVPRSACIFCPYKSDAEWRHLRDSSPSEWQEAVKVDLELRTSEGMRGEAYLHRSCKPLDQVDLRTNEDHGQANLFEEACEGMCGV